MFIYMRTFTVHRYSERGKSDVTITSPLTFPVQCKQPSSVYSQELRQEKTRAQRTQGPSDSIKEGTCKSPGASFPDSWLDYSTILVNLMQLMPISYIKCFSNDYLLSVCIYVLLSNPLLKRSANIFLYTLVYNNHFCVYVECACVSMCLYMWFVLLIFSIYLSLPAK